MAQICEIEDIGLVTYESERLTSYQQYKSFQVIVWVKIKSDCLVNTVKSAKKL